MANDQLCALWVATDRETGEVKKDKHGNTFFTGTWEGKKVVAFLNRPKNNPRAPDITICLAQERQRPATVEEEGGPDAGDEIPF